MKRPLLMGAAVAIGVTIGLTLVSVAPGAEGPTTSLEAEYLGTLKLTNEPPQMAGPHMIYNVTNCTLQGRKIKATCVSPSAGWIHPTLDGTSRVDFRATLKTDEGEFIFAEGSGVFYPGHGFAALLFTTSAETSGWLNRAQGVAKMVGEGGTQYDLFVVR